MSRTEYGISGSVRIDGFQVYDLQNQPIVEYQLTEDYQTKTWIASYVSDRSTNASCVQIKMHVQGAHYIDDIIEPIFNHIHGLMNF
jgi:hypothetical protein